MFYLTVGISIILKLTVLIPKIHMLHDAPYLLQSPLNLQKGKAFPMLLWLPNLMSQWRLNIPLLLEKAVAPHTIFMNCINMVCRKNRKV